MKNRKIQVIVFIIMFTRSSEKICNPIRCTETRVVFPGEFMRNWSLIYLTKIIIIVIWLLDMSF